MKESPIVIAPSTATVSKTKSRQSQNSKRGCTKPRARSIARQPKRPDTTVPKDFRFSADDFEACCRIIEHEVKQRHPAAAHAALDRFLATCELTREIVTLDAPIQILRSVYGDAVGPNERECNSLELAGYLTVQAFLRASKSDFLGLNNVGVITAEKLVSLQDVVRKSLGLPQSDRPQVSLQARS